MPCYNVADTLERALDSIFMQEVDFDYEVIVVDDASTDSTLSIAEDYQKSHSSVVLLRNSENLGNAHSFYNGLVAARGEYFCVLDGDDYYTISDKLKRQIAFLDADANREYVGSASAFIIDFGDGTVHVPPRGAVREFNYADYLARKAGYYHTATYVYRNIYRGNVPEYFKMALYRGDSPRTLFALKLTGKKIYVHDFVGSAYSYTRKGIWSGVDERAHFEYQINFWEQHCLRVNTEVEKNHARAIIEHNKKLLKACKGETDHYEAMSIEDCIDETQRLAASLAFRQKDFVLGGLFTSDWVDSLCVSLGVVLGIVDKSLLQTEVNPDRVCVFNGTLNPRGGGIFSEIMDIAKIHEGQEVYLFAPDMNDISEDIAELAAKRENLIIVQPPCECESRVRWFAQEYKKISPFRNYIYASHKDAMSQVLVQLSSCENIGIFSFDHGFVCGLGNRKFDRILAKRPVDFGLLSGNLDKEVGFLPAWSSADRSIIESLAYEAFRGHDKLVTASGAARFYKLQGSRPYRYIDFVVELLSSLGGKHYHFGPIPEEEKQSLIGMLEEKGVSKDSFIHIEWAEDIPYELLTKRVDVFIESFPVVSYKLTLDVMSAGIPVLAYKGLSRMSITDFVPDNSLFWANQAEFLGILESLNSKKLTSLSKAALSYFSSLHSIEKASERLLSGDFPPPTAIPSFVDNSICEMFDYLPLFPGLKFDVMQEWSRRKKEVLASGLESSLCGSASGRTEAADKRVVVRSGGEKELHKTTIPKKTSGARALLRKFIYVRASVFEKARNAFGEKLERISSGVGVLRRDLETANANIASVRQELASVDANVALVRKELEERAREQTERVANLSDLLGCQVKASREACTVLSEKVSAAVSEGRDASATILRAGESASRKRGELLLGALNSTRQKTVIEHLDCHIVDHCNLNCRGCSVFSPLADEGYSSVAQIESDLSRLAGKMGGDGVLRLHLLGGEPLLHPDIEKVAKIARGAFPGADIDFTTNGLKVSSMPESFWETLRAFDISLKYTRYPVALDYDKMVEFARGKGVRVFSASDRAIQTFKRIPLNSNGVFDLGKSHGRCPYNNCAQLYKGRLFKCPASAFSFRLNDADIEGKLQRPFSLHRLDYIDLGGEVDAQGILDFLESPIPFCRFCDMERMDPSVPWGNSGRSLLEWAEG